MLFPENEREGRGVIAGQHVITWPLHGNILLVFIRETLVDSCNLTEHLHIFLGDSGPISRHWRSNNWRCEGNTDIFAI